jgi:hypothetical protein
MSTPLITTLRENCGYLQDAGWSQTARLMTHAAAEVERLNSRIRELESHLASVENTSGIQAPDASNQNDIRVTAVWWRR